MPRRNRPRSLGASSDHSRKAAWAAATARWISGAAPLVTVATTDWSAGLTMSNVAPPSARIHSPLMYIRLTSPVLRRPPGKIPAARPQGYAANTSVARRTAAPLGGGLRAPGLHRSPLVPPALGPCAEDAHRRGAGRRAQGRAAGHSRRA